MAQPALMTNDEFKIDRTDNNYSSVEIAIRKGIGLDISLYDDRSPTAKTKPL